MRHRKLCGGVFLAIALTLCDAATAGLFIEEQAVHDPYAPGEVEDVHYGEVLFHFYNREYFTSITRLLAARQLERMPNHTDDAEVLLGGLSLSYGMHKEAGNIFRRLLAETTREPVRNQAWYYLGKISFQRGFLDAAHEALGNVHGEMPPLIRADQQLVSAQVLMAQDRFPEATQLLSEWEGPESWKPYADYNLGVALIRSGAIPAGTEVLDALGRLEAEEEETYSLKDKANLALGYALLQDDQPQLARRYLERVRLDGPYSNMALLAVGWADTEAEAYQRALVPWTELHTREVIDPAVQESILALPFAYARLGVQGRAAGLYRQGLAKYSQEITRIDSSMRTIREGQLLPALLRDAPDIEMGWLWHLRTLPKDEPATLYLEQLLAGHEFQEGLKNYRDLGFLKRKLEYWVTSIDAFEAMIATRRERFDAMLPRAQKTLDGLDVGAVLARRDALLERLREVEHDADPLDLATGEEHEQWQRLSRIGERLERMRSQAGIPVTNASQETSGAPSATARDIATLGEKRKLIKGVLAWRLNDQYPQRLWDTRKQLKQLVDAVDETRERRESLRRAIADAPTGFEGFDQRLLAQRAEIERLQPGVEVVLHKQGEYLHRLALAELERRKGLLESYRVQARFALSQTYDRAASDAVVPAPEDGEPSVEPEEGSSG
ncbi:MAG: hypothetical protein ACR2RB_02755 [Gammaproteobacteria bacterium]